MGKVVKIFLVRISKGYTAALDKNLNEIKITRTQRNILCKWKDPNYEQNIEKAFQTPNILAPGFSVEHNGMIVYKKD